MPRKCHTSLFLQSLLLATERFAFPMKAWLLNRAGFSRPNSSAPSSFWRRIVRFQSCKAEMELLESGKYGPLDQDMGL